MSYLFSQRVKDISIETSYSVPFCSFIEAIYLFRIVSFRVFLVLSFFYLLWCALLQYFLCSYYLVPVASRICGSFFPPVQIHCQHLHQVGNPSFCHSSTVFNLFPFEFPPEPQIINSNFDLFMSKISLLCSHLYFVALVLKKTFLQTNCLIG